MNEMFLKMCQHLLNKENNINDDDELDKEEYRNTRKKAHKYLKKLKKETHKIGYDIDFESFCNLLENYISQKDNMTDEEKKQYLKILVKLSQLHEVNLREELEKYVTTKKLPQINEREIFNQFCHYYINSNSSVEEYNSLKELAQNNNINFKEYEENAITYVENLKQEAESLGLSTNYEQFPEILNKYLNAKIHMTDQEKSKVLRVLASISDIYGINLRDLLTITPSSNKEDNDSSHLSISNPLDNKIFLKAYLLQRYQTGSFNVSQFEPQKTSSLKSDWQDWENNLIYILINIFLEKWNNYAREDINELYLNDLTVEDVEKMTNITLEEIKEFDSLSPTLKDFIINLKDTVDITKDHIGSKTKNLLNVSSSPNILVINLNGEIKTMQLIMTEYIKNCLSQNIPYDLTYNDSNNSCLIYTSLKDFKTKINILEDILNMHSQLSKNLKKPFVFSGCVKKRKYGIMPIGYLTPDGQCLTEYPDYLNNIAEVSYYRTISKIITPKLNTESHQKMIQDFIDLENYQNDKASYNPLNATYNGKSFREIKDIINSYIPEIRNTLSIYMDDPEKIEIIVNEFKKSFQYITNKVEGRDKKAKMNLIINSYLENRMQIRGKYEKETKKRNI